MSDEKQGMQTDPELKELVKILLTEKAKEIQAKEIKEAAEKAERLQTIKDQMAAAQAKNESDRIKRSSCLHQTVNAATNDRRSAWRGQVNSDGTYSPVCCLCQTVMPKIKATDAQKKDGVNLHSYIEFSVAAMERMHKTSYPDGCERSGCYVCFPVADLVSA